MCDRSGAPCVCARRLETACVADVLGAFAEHQRHLHLWAYFPYRRYRSSISRHRFAVDCVPVYERWYGCWVRPSCRPPRRVNGISAPVLQVDLVYHDVPHNVHILHAMVNLS